MGHSIRLSAVTRADRNTLISEISDSVAKAGGWIDDVHFFSNISIALNFAIPSSAGWALAEAFKFQPMQFDPDDLAKLTDLTASTGGKEVTCSLQITFFHNDPDLRRHIPSV